MMAPSILAVIGRYVLHPGVFDALDDTPSGRGGEIQLTDAVETLAKVRASTESFSADAASTPETSSGFIPGGRNARSSGRLRPAVPPRLAGHKM